MKPNPNHFIIIDKWNNKVFKKYYFELFNLIDKIMTTYLYTYYIHDTFSNFADIKTFNLGDKV